LHTPLVTSASDGEKRLCLTLACCAVKELLTAKNAKKNREGRKANQIATDPHFTVSVKLSGVSDPVVAVIVTVPAFEPVV
jgi:hypothetical protein